MFERVLSFENIEDESVFLFGARQTGKSTLLQMRYPDAKMYDLLERNTSRCGLPAETLSR